MKLLIKDIGTLVQIDHSESRPRKGKTAADLPTMENAWLLIEGDKIAGFGERNRLA